jgi:hypothetical protein
MVEERRKTRTLQTKASSDWIIGVLTPGGVLSQEPHKNREEGRLTQKMLKIYKV